MIISLISISLIALIFIFYYSPRTAHAHCDTMLGPAVLDGRKSLEDGNINHALKWVMPDAEDELRSIFEQARKVRLLNIDAEKVADLWFLENFVRLHRAGEGVSYEGLKPVGYRVDPKIIAADECISQGSLEPLAKYLDKQELNHLEERFTKAISLKGFDVNDLPAARKYIAAYVSFFKAAEGEEDSHHAHSH